MSVFCVLAENCSVFDRHHKIPGLAHGFELCDGCFDEAFQMLAELRYDYVDLSQLIPRSASPTDAKICRPKPSSVPPVDLNAFTLRSDLAYALLLWERHVRDAEGDPQRDTRGREGFNVDVAVRHLSCRVNVLAGLGPVEDFHDGLDAEPYELDGAQGLLRLHALRRRARAFCGLAQRLVKLPGDCFACGAPALRREEGGERVWCGHCRAAWTHGQYLARLRGLPVTPCS